VVYKSGSFDEAIWGKRAEGLPVPRFDLTRDITSEELSYLHQKFGYVQLLNPYAMGEFGEIRFVRAPSGWLILNYKNAMTASPGELLLTDAAYSHEGDQLTRLNTGTGTRIKQTIDTASFAVRMAVEEEHWPAIHVINGTSLMCWGVWMAAKELNLELTGYVPSKAEVAKYERIKANCPTLVPLNIPQKRL
jgi:hypothetical protein